jgi:hypothetical protein
VLTEQIYLALEMANKNEVISLHSIQQIGNSTLLDERREREFLRL